MKTYVGVLCSLVLVGGCYNLTLSPRDNEAPITAADQISVDEDAPLTLTFEDLTQNDSDPNGDTLEIIAVSNPSIGQLILDPVQRTLVFTPPPNASGSTSFTYTISDGDLTADGDVSVTINALNDLPVVDPITVTTNEDTSATLVFSGSDVENDAFTFVVVSPPSNGVFTPDANGGGVYTPDPNFFGTDTFTVRAEDADPGPEATITINVLAVNDDPSATDDAIVTDEDTDVSFSLQGDDIEDPNNLTFTILGPPQSGTLDTTNLPAVVYTPDPNFNGADSFTFSVEDPDGGAAIGTVSLSVNPINDPPVAQDQPIVIVLENTQRVVVLSAIDADNDGIQFTITQGPQAGGALDAIIDNNPNDQVAFVAYNAPNLAANEPSRSDPFTFTASDGTFNSTGTITMDIRGSDTPPTAVDDNLTGNEDQPLLIDPASLLLNDLDPDPGDQPNLAITAVNNATNGSVSLIGGVITFTPNQNFNGNATFQYTVTDSLLDDVGLVTINFASINNPPAFDALNNRTVNEDVATQNVSITGVVPGPATATDENSQTVVITATSSDPTIVPNPTVGAVSGGTATLSFAPALDKNGTVTITVTATDNGGTANGGVNTFQRTFTITVNAVNDPPAFNAIANQNINEDAGTQNVNITGVVPGPATATDESGQTVVLSAVSNNVGLVPNPTVGAVSGGNATLTYTPIANASGTATITVTATDNGGTANGGVDTFQRTFTITVNAINDGPINTVPGAQTTNEDTNLVFSGASLISVADIDVGAANLQETITATNGTFTLSTTTGLTFTTGDGTNDPTMTFTGSLIAINNALFGLTFIPTPNFNGSASLTINTNDQGNTGAGGAFSDNDTINITVNAINDAPINTVPGAQTTNEDTNRVFSSGNGNQISIADVDVAAANLQETLTVTNGAITLSTTTGLTFTVGDGTNDPTMTFTGSLTNINNALNGLAFIPTPNFNGSASLTINTNDQGNTGAGGALSDIDTVNITVNAVNDAPVNTVPGAQTTNEDTNLVFSSGNGNQISTSDLDIGVANAQETLTATNGTITLGSTAGLTFTTGDGTNDPTMVFTGTLTAINNALATVTFIPTPNFNGTASLAVTTNDQGNTGAGGALSDSDTINITVNAINDAPVNTVPGAQTTNEDTNRVFSSGNGNQISIADVDAGAGILQETLTATNGTITLGSTAGLTFTTGDGTADGSMVFTGNLTAINNALATITFIPTPNFNGTAALVINTNDQGNTGAGGALSDNDTITITVNAVNDAPVNTVPGSQTTNEDTNLVFSSGNGNQISIADIDVAAANLQETLTATNGTFTLATTAGLTFTTGDGTNDPSMVFTGTLTAINNALATITFIPTPNANGAASLTVNTNDQGNTGAGGALSDNDVISITINAINDAPVNTVPGAQTTNEDINRVFSSGNGNQISIADVDAGGGNLQETLTATNGTFTLATTTGLTFTTGDGTNDPSMVFTGTLTAINNALATVTFIPTPNFNGSASLAITTNDQGNTGAGGALSDSDTITITVNAVNDAPVNTVPGSQNTNEDTNLVFSSGNGNQISIADIDVAAANLQETLTATNGTITLGSTAGLTFTTGDGTADPSMVFTGTLTAINNALATITFIPTPNFNGTANLSVSTNDQGNTGAGGSLVDTDVITINVISVNDLPVAAADSGATNEDVNFVVSIASLLSNDTDVEGPVFFVTTQNATNGTVSNDGTDVTFVPDSNFNGTASFEYVITDGIDNDTAVVTITVNAINDAPVNTVPGAQTTNEDTNRVFSSGNGNQISIADVDVAAGNLQETLTATNGTITLGSTAGLTFTTGDGTADPSMVFTGNLTAINNALATITFIPTPNFNGSASLAITTSDQGNTGAGGVQTDNDTINITVNAVNDAPVNTVPGLQDTGKNTPVIFSAANSNLISVTDIDAGSLSITLSVDTGALTLSGITGLSFTTGDGTADASMVFTGAPADINAALLGMSFTPATDLSSLVTLTLLTSDLGNTGAGGTLTDTDTVKITVHDCGDGIVEVSEFCDDVNNDNADGCSATCTVEAGFNCFNPAAAPSVCDDLAGSNVRNESDVNEEADFCNLQFPLSFTKSSAQLSDDIFGRIFEDDGDQPNTSAPGPNAQIAGEVGFGPLGSDPTTDGGWSFFATVFNTQIGNDDEYSGDFIVPVVTASTNFSYTYRFTFNADSTYTYCDSNGAGANSLLVFEDTQLGTMTINP